ncbi:glutathione S-transferase Mu 4-like [Procambarus clarkii]
MDVYRFLGGTPNYRIPTGSQPQTRTPRSPPGPLDQQPARVRDTFSGERPSQQEAVFNMAPVVGYWNIRGMGQPIRLLLAYLETDFQDKTYTAGPAPDYFEKSDWFPVKFALGLDFPNLPYYIDGDVKITQSNAILRYIGRQHDLCGKTEQEKIRVDVLENLAMDMRRSYAEYVYRNYDTQKEEYAESLKKTLKMLSDFLGDKPWFVGDQITYPDFLLYELLDVNLEVDSACLDDTQNLQEFVKRFEALPTIKKYMSSPSFMKTPLNGPMAKFGNK